MELTQMDVYKMEGISNLPMSIRVPFAKAWFAEHNGDHALAADFLDKAIEAERVFLGPIKAK